MINDGIFFMLYLGGIFVFLQIGTLAMEKICDIFPALNSLMDKILEFNEDDCEFEYED